MAMQRRQDSQPYEGRFTLPSLHHHVTHYCVSHHCLSHLLDQVLDLGSVAKNKQIKIEDSYQKFF